MPYGRRGAHWALRAGGAGTLRGTAFDPCTAAAAVRGQSSYPDVAEWADYFLDAHASDAEAISTFGPRDRQ